MPRIIFVLAMALLAACTSVATSRRTEPSTKPRPRPNVLVILTDDQRKSGTLGVLGDTTRWFEEHGTRFTNAFATTPLCCPFRASLFTGRYAHNHGVRTNPMSGVLDQRSTLQRYLGDAGYRTAIAGKYLNSWDESMNPPHFDRWAIFTPEFTDRNYYDDEFNLDGRLRIVHRYSTDFIASKSVRFLEDFERQDEAPWLLYTTPFAPHKPYTAEASYAEASVPNRRANPALTDRDRSDKPPFLRSLVERQRGGGRIRRDQLRTLMSVDDLVARIAAVLDELGETDRTLAFFMSDSGYLWGEHGLVKKMLPYSQSVEIPLLVRWPRGLSSPPVDHRLVANIDIAPTVIDAARISPDLVYELDGRSLLGRARRRRLLIEYWRDRPEEIPTWASTVTSEFQYTEYYARDGSTVTFREYYDRSRDPWQLHNLAVERPAGSQSLAQIARTLRRDRTCAAGGCP